MRGWFIFICILICDCKQNPDTVTYNCIDFYSNPGSEISNLSEIATDIEYIPLQISGSGIMNIRITNDKYYIKNYSGEIECLDKNGKYLYKLSKKGTAADEYKSIQDYDITSDGKLLAISTYEEVKIYKNDGADFIFLKSIDLNKGLIIPSTLSFVPEKTYLLLSFHNLGTEPFIDILHNLEGDTLAVRFNYHQLKKSLKNNVFLRNVHYKYNNALHFKEPVNDTIYLVDWSGKIKPYIVLDSHGKQLTQKNITRIQSGRSQKRLWDYFNVFNLYETSRYMIGLIIYGKKEFFRIYDKAINKYYSFAGSSLYIEDNIAGGVDFMPQYCDGNKLYYWISASNLKDHVANEGFSNSEALPEKKACLKELTDSLNAQINQILIVVTPRK